MNSDTDVVHSPLEKKIEGTMSYMGILYIYIFWANKVIKKTEKVKKNMENKQESRRVGNGLIRSVLTVVGIYE